MENGNIRYFRCIYRGMKNVMKVIEIVHIFLCTIEIQRDFHLAKSVINPPYEIRITRMFTLSYRIVRNLIKRNLTQENVARLIQV